MKFELFAVIASALLLFGCTGQAPQVQAPEPPQAMPPAPGNAETPQVPEGAEAAPPAPPASVPPAPGNEATPIMPPGEGNAAIAASELAMHNQEGDCWFGYKGKVYDATSLIPSHKNYQALLVPLCGTSSEFEAAFEGKHGTSKVEVLIGNSELIGDLSP